MLTIDGSQGEGGGQVLRSSLALSLATGTPVRIHSIRAGRSKPGLLRQHLTALRAATLVGAAEVTGSRLGSDQITFQPTALAAGDHELDIGSAGSTMLVLQTVLVPLLLAKGTSTLVLGGGTHNPMAPPLDFLERCFLPLLERMGARVQVDLVRPGFYPAGGGKVQVRIEPLVDPVALELLERGSPTESRGTVLLSRLPRRIGEAERGELARAMRMDPAGIHIEEREDSTSPGNVLSLELGFEQVREVVTSFGERGRTARSVARGVARAAHSYLSHDAPVGEHLADQLLVPLALLAGGTYRTGSLSMHTRTNIDVVRAFLGDVVQVEEQADSCLLHVRGRLRS